MEIWQPLAGGVLIGLASFILYIGIGRVAGISGILGQLIPAASRGDALWRALFIGGLIVGGLVMVQVMPTRFQIPNASSSFIKIVVAGLCVGLGTRFANGCTSGHGVCGISRFSIRSLVATLVFMASGIATVLLVRIIELGEVVGKI